MEELAWMWVKEQFALLQHGLRLLLIFWADAVPALWKFSLANSQALNHLALILAGIIGIPLLWIRTKAADRQARTGEQGHITDRFTKAIEQLGSKKMAVRLGAIYALERISKDSPDDHWTIMETLTAYVRENAIAPFALSIVNGEHGRVVMLDQLPAGVFDGINTNQFIGMNTLQFRELDMPTQHILSALLGTQGPLKHRADTDIQTILTVLGRRNKEMRKQDAAEGRRLDLAVTDLRGANLNGAHLERASLSGADLRLASLAETKLKDATLFQADLRGTHFLTQEQINSAHGNDKTMLPEGVTRPDHWPKPDASPTTPPPSPPPPPEAPPDTPTHTSR